MSDDILERIRTNKNTFSKGHKKIADYILENYDRCAFMTATKLGQMSGVSESTVVRFPLAIGYSGYPEMQKELEKILQDKIQSYDKIDVLNSKLTTDMVINNVLTMDARKIEHIITSLDMNSFNAAVDDLLSAETVYVIGLRNCQPLSHFLGYYLKMIRKNVVVISSGDSNEFFETIRHITSNDVIVGISFPRYSMRTLKALEFANSKSAKVISITDSKHSPMNMYSSCNLLARTDMASIVESMVAPMSLINAIIVSMCLRNSENVVANIEELNALVEDYGYEGNDDIDYLDEDMLKDLKGFSDKKN